MQGHSARVCVARTLKPHGGLDVSIAPRTLLIATIVASLAMVFATSAFAEAPSLSGGYVNWSDVATMTGQGSSPHGGYSTTTVKCGVCHAVHNAATTASSSLYPELLLQDAVSEACNYCHVGGAGGYTQVYGGDRANYSDSDLPNAHNVYLDGVTVQGVTCNKCHQVHGADGQMTANAYLTTKILRGDKTYDTSVPNYDNFARAPLSTDDSSTALTKWCAGCHFLLSPYPYYYDPQMRADGYAQQSHIMTTATATFSNPESSYTGRVAWKDSTYCFSCHSSGFGTAAWPHWTAGERFLESASGATATATGALDSREDGVCLRCHRSGSEGAGFGF